MGPTAEPVFAMAALTALGGALHAEGCKLDLGAGIEVALDAAAVPERQISRNEQRRGTG